MNEIISILMRRDHMTREDAIDLILQTQEEIYEAISEEASYDDIQDILEYNLSRKVENSQKDFFSIKFPNLSKTTRKTFLLS